MSGPLRLGTVLAVLLLSGSTLQAADSVLDSLLAVALKNNPELNSARQVEQAAIHDSRSAGALPDPTLSVAAMNMPRGSFILDEAMMSGIGLGIHQMIPWPGKLRARTEFAGLLGQQQHQSTRAVGNRLIREVSKAYYEYSYWRLAQNLIAENLDLARATAEAAETRYAHGGGPAHDAFGSLSASARLEVRWIESEERVAAAEFRLMQLLGDTTRLGELTPSLPMPAVVDTTVGADVSANPMVTQSELEVEKANTGLKLARSGYWPDISLGLKYLIRDEIPMDASLGKDWWSLEVGVTVPLWFFAKQRHRTAASRERLEAARAARLDVRQIVQREARDIRRMLTTLSRSLAIYDSSIVPQASATFESAQVSYEVGKVDFNSLLDAQMTRFDVGMERLELLKQLNQKAAELQEIIGIGYQVES